MVEVISAGKELSTIVNCYLGKDDYLERGNYRGLKFTDQTLKIAEKIIRKLIRQQVGTDETRLGFMPGCGTTNVIFILRLL